MRCLCLILMFIGFTAAAQPDSLSHKKRKLILGSGSAVLTAGSLLYLNEAWYSQYNTGDFHFFDDNAEWLQVDKVGHLYSTYQTGRLMMQAFDWAGFSKKQKLFIGGTSGLIYLTAVECMDGFSRGWGFSWGDEGANLLGSALAISQEALWNEQKLQLKFSFARSGLARYNPALLGETAYTEVLKDYNGQTYWLSVCPAAFLKKESRFPKWLAVSLGYKGYGMLGARKNQVIAQDEKGNVLSFDRERKYFLSLDVDLSQIRTKSRFLNGLFSVINILKFPAPALQFSNKGLRAHYLYY